MRVYLGYYSCQVTLQDWINYLMVMVHGNWCSKSVPYLITSKAVLSYLDHMTLLTQQTNQISDDVIPCYK